MKTYKTENIRNVGLYGHQGSGKTSLAEAMAFLGGSTTRLLSPAQGNSNFDYEDEEVKRRSTMKMAIGYGVWKNKLINIIDNPGDTNFIADALYSIPAVDIAILTVSSVDGVEVGTEKFHEHIKKAKLPAIIAVTKVDKERSSFENTLQAIEELENGVVPVIVPLGEESNFKGIINLLKKKAFIYEGDPKKGKEVPIEGEFEEIFEKYREKLVEKVAEQDDELIEKYFEEGDLGPEEVLQGLKTGIVNGSIVPLVTLSASEAYGVDQLLDFIVEFGPTPDKRPALKAKKDGEDAEIAITEDGPFVGYVFKTMIDPYAGKVTLFRVISGTINSDTTVVNTNTGSKERLGQLFKLLGKKQEPVGTAHAGDLVGVAKLKETRTGHTLTDEAAKDTVIEPPTLPVRSIAFAIKPRTQGDEDKVSGAMAKIIEEDPGLAWNRDSHSNEFLLEGMGQVHIEATVEKMKRKFGVDVELKMPKVPYRETITKKVTNVEGKHKKQTGGHGQFGVCYIDIEPLERGKGFEFVNDIFGGAIPRQFIPSVEKGIRDTMARGVLAGYPVVDVKVRLFDGKYHPVDSDGRSFEIAGSKAFKEAFKKAGPVLLEPIMKMEIVAPEENVGDVIGDISSKRGRIVGTEQKGKNQIIKVLVPMSEVLVYSSDLRSLTSGRGSFTMEFSHYEQVPSNIAQKIIEEAQVSDEED